MDYPRAALDGTQHPFRQDAVRSWTKGFTLTELLIVVSVMGLLIAFGVPSMSGYIRSTRLTGATNMMIADIHYARSLATAKRRTYQVAFDSLGYSIAQASPWDVIRSRELPRGVNCAATDTVTLFAWGLTTPTTITVNGHDGTKTLQVSANGSVSHD